MNTIALQIIGAFLNLLACIAPRQAARKGFALLCKPFRTSITDKHKMFFTSANNQCIAHGKAHLQLYRWGRGNIKLLFIHGWQSHSYLWKRYIESLDHSLYTIYAFDGPGHGQTPGNFMTMLTYSEAIGNVLETIEKVDHVVAHSIGSFALLHCLHVNPGLTPKSAVLLSSPGSIDDFFTSFQAKLALSQRCIGLVKREFEKLTSKQTGNFIATRYAESIMAKGLLIHDTQDPEISVRHSRDIHSRWKNSILIETRGLGHNLKSDKVIELVLGFINTGQIQKATANLANVER